MIKSKWNIFTFLKWAWCFDMIGINILTLLKQESQSDSARLLPGENGSKIDRFPGKDLISIKPSFLMEKLFQAMFSFSPVQRARFQEGPGSPACQAPESFPGAAAGRESCLHPAGKGRDGEGRTHPCALGSDSLMSRTGWCWSLSLGKGHKQFNSSRVCPLLRVHVHAHMSNQVHHSRTKFSNFYLGKSQEQTFSVENQNHCILKCWSFAEKPSSHFRNSLV